MIATADGRHRVVAGSAAEHGDGGVIRDAAYGLIGFDRGGDRSLEIALDEAEYTEVALYWLILPQRR